MNDTEKQQQMWDINHQIGQSIQALRLHNELSIEQAAERSELTEKRVAAMERGNLPHAPYLLARYAESIGGRLAIIPQESPDDPHCQFIEFED